MGCIICNILIYFSESLRMWTPAILTDRKAVRPYTIPAREPGEKDLHLEQGTICSVPIYNIHRDERYYPNPNKFDPERFNDENKNKILPGTYLPFGIGPRNCIGNIVVNNKNW